MAPAGTHIVANGLRVYYEVHGEGKPLLLIHGGTATSQARASHLPAFAEHFRIFTPDSRGHGSTDNPTGELGYRVMADDVAAFAVSDLARTMTATAINITCGSVAD